VPNAPKTPTRTVRVAERLWGPAKEKAHSKGMTVTEIIVKALEDFLAEE
jgi:hypothetical protein